MGMKYSSELDTIKRSKNIRKGDIAREGDGGRTS